MPSCAISTCTNTDRTQRRNGNFGFHKFPKDKKIQKVWVQLCKRKDKIRTESAMICTEHFTSEQYDVDKVNRALNLPERRILKPGSVPTANLPHKTTKTPKGDPKKINERAERLSLRNKQRQSTSTSIPDFSNQDLAMRVDALINKNNELISMNLEEQTTITTTTDTTQNWNSTRAVPTEMETKMEDPLPLIPIQKSNSSPDMKTLTNNSIEFEKILENVVVKCEPTCSTCCQFMSQLGEHLLQGHSSTSANPNSSTANANTNQVNLLKCNFCDEKFLTASDFQVHLTCHVVPYDDQGTHRTYQPRILRKKKFPTSYRPQVPEGQRKTNSTARSEIENNFVYIPDDIKREMEPEEIEIIQSPSPFFIPDDDTNSEPGDPAFHSKGPHDSVPTGNGRLPKRPRKMKLSSKKRKIPQHKCKKCGECFSNKFSLRSHNFNQHTEKKSYQCETCGDFFKSITGLNQHNRLHEFPGECGFCDDEIKFLNQSEFIDHLTSAHTEILEKPYKCGICDTGFSKSNELDTHFLQVHPNTYPYICEVCDKRFDDEKRFKWHGVNHTRESTYMCEHCSKSFKTSFKLEKHIKTHTKEKPYKCNKCERSFNVEENLIRHQGSHKGYKRPFKCDNDNDNCTQTFKTKKELETHLLQIHNDQAKVDKLGYSRTPVEEKYRACGICKFKCGYSKILTAHLRTRHSDFFGQNFACKVCEQKFHSERQVTSHLKQFHPTVSPHECDICHKKFEWKDELVPHYRLHTGEKPFSCTHAQCSKSFRTMIQLSIHNRVHTGEKPYSCRLCPKSFATMPGLINHKAIHSDTRSFKCDIDMCNKSFKRKSSLYVHKMFTHKGEGQGQGMNVKRYTCEECGKSFRCKPNLTNHTKLHTGQRDHTCEECGKGFIRPYHLRRHINNVHISVK